MASITIGFSSLRPSSIFISSSSSHHKNSPATLFSKTPLSSSNRVTTSSTQRSSSSYSYSLSFSSSRWKPCSATAEPALEPAQIAETAEVQEPGSELAQLAQTNEIPKGAEVFAVVMVGSRQYIVIPGRSIYTQRLKGASVNDKIILNKVLLVGAKTETYVGMPVVPNAAVHAVVEEQGLSKKVIVFKYKKRKNYRRTIGHRQPNTRLRITGITGYQDSPAAATAVAS